MGGADLTVSIQQAMNDTRALGEIPSPHTTALADTAADIELVTSTEASALKADGYASIASTTGSVAITISQAKTLSGDDIAVIGAPVTASGTVAAMTALSTTEASHSSAKDTFWRSSIRQRISGNDNEADRRAVDAQRDGDQREQYDGVAGPLAGGGVEVADMKVSAPPAIRSLISETAANLEALTASQITGLPAIGAAGLVSTNANVSYTSTQTAAILSGGLTVSAAGSYTVTENFANGDYSVYQGGQLIQQKSVNPDGSYDITYFNVTGQAYSSYEGSLQLRQDVRGDRPRQRQWIRQSDTRCQRVHDNLLLGERERNDRFGHVRGHSALGRDDDEQEHEVE